MKKLIGGRQNQARRKNGKNRGGCGRKKRRTYMIIKHIPVKDYPLVLASQNFMEIG